MNKQRMRLGPTPRLEWSVSAVTASDPVQFAQELQALLQQLTDEGFTLHGQTLRGTAQIVTASRVCAEPPEDTQPDVERQRRRPGLPSARSHGRAEEEVSYHFLENGVLRRTEHSGIVGALRAVRRHLKEPAVLPVGIISISVTRFEPDSFASLLHAFADDLKE